MKQNFVRTGIACIALLLGNPVANASQPSRADIAEALVYSGCTYALLNDPVKLGMNSIVEAIITLRLNLKIVDDGSAPDALTKMDFPSARKLDEHIQQSWVTAGVLDSKWKPLMTNLNLATKTGFAKWKSGSTFGVSDNAAKSASTPSLVAFCRISQINVTNKAKKSKASVKGYVLKTTGQYLPPLPK
jgi:hypothetical protein